MLSYREEEREQVQGFQRRGYKLKPIYFGSIQHCPMHPCKLSLVLSSARLHTGSRGDDDCTQNYPLTTNLYVMVIDNDKGALLLLLLPLKIQFKNILNCYLERERERGSVEEIVIPKFSFKHNTLFIMLQNLIEYLLILKDMNVMNKDLYLLKRNE